MMIARPRQHLCPILRQNPCVRFINFVVIVVIVVIVKGEKRLDRRLIVIFLLRRYPQDMFGAAKRIGSRFGGIFGTGCDNADLQMIYECL